MKISIYIILLIHNYSWGSNFHRTWENVNEISMSSKSCKWKYASKSQNQVSTKTLFPQFKMNPHVQYFLLPMIIKSRTKLVFITSVLFYFFNRILFYKKTVKCWSQKKKKWFIWSRKTETIIIIWTNWKSGSAIYWFAWIMYTNHEQRDIYSI